MNTMNARQVRALERFDRALRTLERWSEEEQRRRAAFIGPIATRAQLKQLAHEQRCRETKPTGVFRPAASVASILGNVYVAPKGGRS